MPYRPVARACMIANLPRQNMMSIDGSCFDSLWYVFSSRTKHSVSQPRLIISFLLPFRYLYFALGTLAVKLSTYPVEPPVVSYRSHEGVD